MLHLDAGLHQPARGAKPQPSGRIASLDITQLHVPHALSASLAGRYADWTGKAENAQRFRATVAVGRRLEPWIVDLRTSEPLPQ